MGDNKKKNSAAKPKVDSAPQVNQKVYDQFMAAIKQSQANQSGNANKGIVYTKQEADAGVQSVWQQIFGKNALGIDYKKAVDAYLNQSQDTSAAGRQQAVLNYAQSTPEYKAMQQDKYLDAIYNAIQANVRKAQV